MAKEFDYGDFCLIGLAPEHRLSKVERMTLIGGAETEKFLKKLTGKYNLVSVLGQSKETNWERLKREVNLYKRAELKQNFEQEITKPFENPKITSTTLHGLKDGEVLDFILTSDYEPICKESNYTTETFPYNRSAYFRYWKHHSPAKACVFCIHPAGLGDLRSIALSFLPGRLYRMGLDLVLYQLPFHGHRGSMSAASNQSTIVAFPSLNVSLTNEMVAQAVYELRIMMNHFKAQHPNCKQVFMGISLGAFIAAMASSYFPVDYLYLISAFPSLGDIVLKLAKQLSLERTLIENQISLEDLKASLEVFAPLERKTLTKNENIFLVGAQHDELIDSEETHRLREQLDHPRIKWLKEGHITTLEASTSLNDFYQFMNLCNLTC